jgi:hypothetical protein
MISQYDNANDGKEDKRVVSKDQNGFAIGGEAKDHGDFVSSVIKANSRSLQPSPGCRLQRSSFQGEPVRDKSTTVTSTNSVELGHIYGFMLCAAQESSCRKVMT